MERRDVLWTLGAATLIPSGTGAAQTDHGATVVYDGRAIALDRISLDPAKGDAL